MTRVDGKIAPNSWAAGPIAKEVAERVGAAGGIPIIAGLDAGAAEAAVAKRGCAGGAGLPVAIGEAGEGPVVLVVTNVFSGNTH